MCSYLTHVLMRQSNHNQNAKQILIKYSGIMRYVFLKNGIDRHMVTEFINMFNVQYE